MDDFIIPVILENLEETILGEIKNIYKWNRGRYKKYRD